MIEVDFAKLMSYSTALVFWYRRTAWLGGGAKFVIILGANQGGGVMEWKGAREWAIERDSVKNKKKYAAKWGYELDIVDMSTKKRYAHEWRESWEKVDVIRNAMKKYPDAEWFVDTVLTESMADTDISQVLVAGSQHLHNGADLLLAVPHLHALTRQCLPRHQHLQSTKDPASPQRHFCIHVLSKVRKLPRSGVPLRCRRWQTRKHQLDCSAGLRRLQSWFILRQAQPVD